MSAWLTVALTSMGLPWLLVSFMQPLLKALPRLQEQGPEGLFRLAHEIASAPSPAWLNVYALVTQALLAWFTYFSGSPRVKEHDEFWVFVAMCFAALGWLQTFLTWAGL